MGDRCWWLRSGGWEVAGFDLRQPCKGKPPPWYRRRHQRAARWCVPPAGFVLGGGGKPPPWLGM